MTTRQITTITEKVTKMKEGFFDGDVSEVDYLYDRLLEIPHLILEHNSQLGDESYASILNELIVYENAITAIKNLNKVDTVFAY